MRGFTLLEVMIGVFIVLLSTLGISMLQARLIKAHLFSEQQFEASVLADRKMEELRNFSTLTAFGALSSGSDSVTGKNASYNRAWTVTTTASPSYKTVGLTVSWVSSEAVTESVVLSSVIAGVDPYLAGKLISVYSPVPIP